MTTWALVPVKAFGRAKSRLGAHLAPEQRARLARAMCEHTLRTLAEPALREAGLAGTLLFTGDDEVAACGGALGVESLHDADFDPKRPRLACVIDTGLGALVERGATAALVLMADLPALDVASVAALLDTPADAAALAPDHTSLNTNALHCALPFGPTAFGSGGSLRPHVALSGQLGRRVVRIERPALGADLDTPDMLERAPASLRALL
ncbi:MAG: hypothetical protein GKR94_31575 [Gammaproteobacteria bacterium]|nr:hypothetical protein [Gammaproteobacteria bacterium]